MAERTRKQKKQAAANRAARARANNLKRKSGERATAFQARQAAAFSKSGGDDT